MSRKFEEITIWWIALFTFRTTDPRLIKCLVVIVRFDASESYCREKFDGISISHNPVREVKAGDESLSELHEM